MSVKKRSFPLFIKKILEKSESDLFNVSFNFNKFSIKKTALTKLIRPKNII